jgi:hypothetical protein
MWLSDSRAVTICLGKALAVVRESPPEATLDEFLTAGHHVDTGVVT